MCWVSEGNHRAMSERKTKFSSPELIYNLKLSKRKHEDTAFSVQFAIYLKQNE